MFLRDVQQQLARKELYNLDEEFSKTRKNRSPVVILSISLFVIVMVAIGIAVTTYIQRRSQNVPVNVASFQDVNLMSLLDRAKQINDKLTIANRNLQTVQQNEGNDISSVQDNEAHEIDLVNNELISASAKRSRIAVIRSRAQTQIAAIHAKYADPLKKARDEISNLQNQAAQYDTHQMQEAKKQEAVLNNQQKLFDMQMKQTEDYYNHQLAQQKKQAEAQIATLNRHHTQIVDLLKQNQATEIANLIKKYNPTFTSPSIVSLLNEQIPVDPSSDAAQAPFERLAVQAGVVSASSINDLQTRIANFALLISALQKVPYENSIPPTLAHLSYFNHQIVSGYRSIGKGLTEIIAQKNNQIQQLHQKVASVDGVIASKDAIIAEYDHALTSLIRSSRENGYVLDASNPSKIAVFVDPLYHVKSGDTAYVFRSDDQKIGTIRFTVANNGTLHAQQVSLTKKDVPMKPFDKILLNLK